MPNNKLNYDPQNDIAEIKKIFSYKKNSKDFIEIFEKKTPAPDNLKTLLSTKMHPYWRSKLDARDKKNTNILMLMLHFHPDKIEWFERFLNFLTRNIKIIKKETIETLLTEKNNDKKNSLDLIEKKPELMICLFKFIMNNDLNIEAWTKKIVRNKEINAQHKTLLANYCAKNLTETQLKEITTSEQRKELREFWRKQLVSMNLSNSENNAHLTTLICQHPLSLLKNTPGNYYLQANDSKRFILLLRVWINQLIKVFENKQPKLMSLFNKKESTLLRKLLQCNSDEAFINLEKDDPTLHSETLNPIFEAFKYHSNILASQTNNKNLYPSLDMLSLS